MQSLMYSFDFDVVALAAAAGDTNTGPFLGWVPIVRGYHAIRVGKVLMSVGLE